MIRPALLLVLGALACAPRTGGDAPAVTDATGATIAFSAVLGGTHRDMDMARDVLTDSAGVVFVVGNAASPDFPVTPGALDTVPGGGQFPSDAFVAALGPDGALRWSTVLGGPGFERAYALERRADGDLVIAGRAGDGLPTTPGVVQPTFGGDQKNRAPYGRQDGFVCRLSGDGATLRFCTYLGGADNGFIRDMDLDAEGNIVVVLGSTLGDLPAGWFARAAQPRHGGDEDVVVAKLAADGTRVLWATYLGGPGKELGAPTVRVAPDGTVLVLLSTQSAGLPTPGGFDSTLGGTQDLYLARLAPDGSRIVMGTYVGGSGVEAIETHGLAIGPDSSIYVTGGSDSPDFPTTPGSWRPALADARNGFVVRVSPAGRLLAGSLVGGAGWDYGEGIATDGAGRVLVTGYTESPVLGGDSASAALTDHGDVMVALFSPDLSQLLYGTRVGGSDRDMGRAAAVDRDGWLVVVGHTSSDDWPAHGALPRPGGGGLDAIVLRLRPQAP